MNSILLLVFHLRINCVPRTNYECTREIFFLLLDYMNKMKLIKENVLHKKTMNKYGNCKSRRSAVFTKSI